MRNYWIIYIIAKVTAFSLRLLLDSVSCEKRLFKLFNKKIGTLGENGS